MGRSADGGMEGVDVFPSGDVVPEGLERGGALPSHGLSLP